MPTCDLFASLTWTWVGDRLRGAQGRSEVVTLSFFGGQHLVPLCDGSIPGNHGSSGQRDPDACQWAAQAAVPVVLPALALQSRHGQRCRSFQECNRKHPQILNGKCYQKTGCNRENHKITPAAKRLLSQTSWEGNPKVHPFSYCQREFCFLKSGDEIRGKTSFGA